MLNIEFRESQSRHEERFSLPAMAERIPNWATGATSICSSDAARIKAVLGNRPANSSIAVSIAGSNRNRIPQP